MHCCLICDNEPFTGLNEAIQHPQYVCSPAVILCPGSNQPSLSSSFFFLPLLRDGRGLLSLLLSSILSSPRSVSFDKQICRQCPRITTSFDSQLTVNSQSQGGLHYINGKLDYFFSLETEREFKESRGGAGGTRRNQAF